MENYTEEQMSEESKKMFERMDEKIDKVGKDLGNKIDTLCDKIHSLEITVAKIPESIRKENDLRYAEKETEKLVKDIRNESDKKYAGKETEILVKDIQGWYTRTSLAIICLLITIVAVLIYAVISGSKIIN